LDRESGEWLFFHEGQAFVVDPSGAHHADAYVLIYQREEALNGSFGIGMNQYKLNKK
jgi:hypothetical protein